VGNVKVEIRDSDVWTIERLSDAAMRAGHTQEAIKGYALALRLRMELNMTEGEEVRDAVT
jgi:hypothetical protein